MKFFIPAWYQENQWWRDKNVPFYEKENRSDFDDMISLMNMHKKNSQPFHLIQLAYHSSFQLFLHRNHLYECEYFSIFDFIQGFPKSTPRPLDYRDFNWPEGTEFIYTLFIIKAVNDNEVTNIYYNEDGYLVWMEKFIDNVKVSKWIFDNRGFLSSIIKYVDGREQQLFYLNYDGDILLEENLVTGEVYVRKDFEKFKSKYYTNIEFLIQEQLTTYLENFQVDSVIVAFNKCHNHLIESVISNENIVYSIFKERNSAEFLIEGLHDTKFIVDTKSNENKLLAKINQSNILRITPFDTEVLPSISNQLYLDYIGIFIDGISDKELIKIIQVLQPILLESGKYKLSLLTRKGSHSRTEELRQIVSDVNDKFLEKEDLEDLLEEAIEDLVVIKFEYIPYEVDLLKLISKIRIIVDLSSEPDLYIQIASISSGIPQINKVKNEYVADGMNGLIINDINQLPNAILDYLQSLKQWNASLSYSYKLIEKYSSLNIIKTIDYFLEGGSYGEEI